MTIQTVNRIAELPIKLAGKLVFFTNNYGDVDPSGDMNVEAMKAGFAKMRAAMREALLEDGQEEAAKNFIICYIANSNKSLQDEGLMKREGREPPKMMKVKQQSGRRYLLEQTLDDGDILAFMDNRTPYEDYQRLLYLQKRYNYTALGLAKFGRGKVGQNIMVGGELFQSAGKLLVPVDPAKAVENYSVLPVI
jgi:hypothetical protein